MKKKKQGKKNPNGNLCLLASLASASLNKNALDNEMKTVIYCTVKNFSNTINLNLIKECHLKNCLR